MNRSFVCLLFCLKSRVLDICNESIINSQDEIKLYSIDHGYFAFFGCPHRFPHYLTFALSQFAYVYILEREYRKISINFLEAVYS